MTTAIPAPPRTSAGADPVRPFKVGAYGFVVLGAALLLLPAPPIDRIAEPVRCPGRDQPAR
ncbi:MULTISPECIES: hypothetical protein [unclassified Streptomyces]|uniref:hypothetical protein n=1 Tax=unclassified Streptomyces TaxID=2593676 RepID=UPI000BF130EE|nr:MULTISPECIES: hypothetical protein [unclassified Streptomyces]